ncbi:MAG TPA: hypothetical protein VFI14_09110, partial [Chryseosolibacter sp.]|nr:hypothetical protein [Chryseosolibacter sp.]
YWDFRYWDIGITSLYTSMREKGTKKIIQCYDYGAQANGGGADARPVNYFGTTSTPGLRSCRAG